MKRDPFRVRSLQAALKDFLGAPATGGHLTNEHVILDVMGAKGTRAPDCPTFDAVRQQYEVPKACTFAQAFNACWHGKRDWRDFDLQTLRESHPEFVHLQLPERVQDAMEREAIAGEYERADGARSHVEAPVEEFPPLELLRRGAPKMRRRSQRGAKKRQRACKGSRNACSSTKLARAYQAAKRAYHSAGEQLRMAGVHRDLL